jgi:hypothetical protein
LCPHIFAVLFPAEPLLLSLMLSICLNCRKRDQVSSDTLVNDLSPLGSPTSPGILIITIISWCLRLLCNIGPGFGESRIIGLSSGRIFMPDSLIFILWTMLLIIILRLNCNDLRQLTRKWSLYYYLGRAWGKYGSGEYTIKCTWTYKLLVARS